MLKSNTVVAFCICCMSLFVQAQTDQIMGVLQQVENNNKELKALKSQIERERLVFQSSNNLPDPQAGAYYLPFRKNAGNYVEFEVTQSMEFPTVYSARKELITQQQEQLDQSYAIRRQEVLLETNKSCLEIIHLNKRIATEQERAQKTKTIIEQVQLKFDEGKISVLELNKEKVAWMQERFKLDQYELEKKNILLELQKLNGGEAVSFGALIIEESFQLDSLSILWEQKLSKDPSVLLLNKQSEMALQKLKLTKRTTLPNLTAGYNYQNAGGAINSGVYAGVSIPLWNNRGKVEASKVNVEYSQERVDMEVLNVKAEFEKRYAEYQLLLKKYEEYRSTLLSINNDELLYKAYEYGEISFIEFYMELQFYRNAYDSMLRMEKELSLLKADLLSYNL